MPWSDYQRCPGMDTTLNVEPESVSCPECGQELEIWTDEVKTRCPGCRTVVYNRETPQNRELKKSRERQGGADEVPSVDFKALVDLALEQGATAAALIDPAAISVEEELASHCLEPRCRNYGLSTSCPPHAGGPADFRRWIGEADQAFFFKIDLPTEIFLSSDRKEIGLLVHEIAVSVERAALGMGAKKARAFAGGSCKNLYCSDHPDCNVVDRGGECRHPDAARPSMSGFGVNVNKLAKTAGWKMWDTRGEGAGSMSMGTLFGLVLIG